MTKKESIPGRIYLEKNVNNINTRKYRERGRKKKKKHTHTHTDTENIFEPFYSTGHKLISNSMKEVV